MIQFHFAGRTYQTWLLISPIRKFSFAFIATDKQTGFDFCGYKSVVTTLTKFTDNKDQSQTTEGTAITIINRNQAAVNEDTFNYNTINELFADGHQMFHMDREPMFFDSMSIEDNLNNNIGLEHIKDLDINYSDSWIPAPADLELFDGLLFEDDMMEKKDQPSPATSPIPAPPSPEPVEGVQVKSEDGADFDLIKFIIFGEVSSSETLDVAQTIINDLFSTQTGDLLTPVEEKACPTFDQLPLPQIVIKDEPEPSTSAAPSPKPSTTTEDIENVKSLRRRRAPKRRYSSDSDFSIQTSASSFNATTQQRFAKKKRGRPAKELITELPTVSDFSHVPIEHASHLVLRIKNNEASRKSRMKSKSKETQMEDECDRLKSRKLRLATKQNRLEGQIETLRRWLLGIN